MILTSRVVPVPNENVDTDQIIPARYLKTTHKAGLGRVLMYDWRFDAAGNPRPDFPLNQPEYAGAKILLAGDNFGCGSSREHAPWALADFGFQVVISTSFADIFRNNCFKNGILPLTVSRETHQRLFQLASEQPTGTVTVNLETQTLVLQDGASIQFPVDSFSRKCLLEGVDELGYLLNLSDRIAEYESKG